MAVTANDSINVTWEANEATEQHAKALLEGRGSRYDGKG